MSAFLPAQDSDLPSLELAQSFKSTGQLGKAARCYELLAEASPNDASLHYALATTLQENGQARLAIQSFLRVIYLNRSCENAYRRLWWLDGTPQQLDEAVQVCIQSLADDSQIKPVIYATIGNLLTRLGRIAEASQSFQQASYEMAVAAQPYLVEQYWNETPPQGPHFLLIGGMKCGTTSMYSYLCQHPCVLSAIEKEIHFFSLYYESELDWYLSQFPRIPTGHLLITGEATPYLGTPGVAQRVFKDFPKTKLIILLRNPVDRAYSHYQNSLKYFGAQHTFEQSVNRYLDSKEAKALTAGDETAYDSIRNAYFSFSLYYYSLKEWLTYFPREQLLILKSEDFFTDTASTMRKTYNFLGLQNFELPNYRNTLQGTYSPLSQDLRLKLSRYFKLHNEKLEALVGRSFNWL